MREETRFAEELSHNSSQRTASQLLLPYSKKMTTAVLDHPSRQGTVSNQNHTWRWLAGDITAAAISATLVAPTVAIIDRYAAHALDDLKT